MAHITEIPTEKIGKYTVLYGEDNAFAVCYEDRKPLTDDYWQIQNPLLNRMPVFFLQLCIIIFLTRLVMLIVKPLRQPRFLSELIGGIIVGPCGLVSISDNVAAFVNPFEGSMFLETMANLGVTFYMFLVGLEMDLTPIRKIGKIALSVAIAGMFLPILAGASLHHLVYGAQDKKLADHEPGPKIGGFCWGIALSVTSFPDLARMLSDLKLMNTDLGKTALAAAVVSDIISWLLLVATVSLFHGHRTSLQVTIPVLVGMTALWFIIRPLVTWLIKRTKYNKASSSSSGGRYGDKHVYFVLMAALLCGCLTELCGAHSMFGAFAFGLMIPSGELGTLVMEKIEEFVVGILLPPTFLLAGLRTNFNYVFQSYGVGLVLLVILIACSAKIVSTLLVCLYFNCSKRDSFVLGLLMNTKGVLVLIVLNEGRSMMAFNQTAFSFMVMALLVMTVIIGPLVSYVHKSSRHLTRSYHRTLEKCRGNAPLRVLACIHSTRNLSGLITILRLSNATRVSPITVFAVHLVELTGRATAMLIFHDKPDKVDNVYVNNNSNKANRERVAAEQIIRGFGSLEQDNQAVSTQPLTVVSPYPTMHEDVSNFALEKLANIILIPFHRQPNNTGGWLDENAEQRAVNMNLLATAPCSIGLLVDRGLTLPYLKPEQQPKSIRMKEFRVAMLFVKGHDDREALAYAWRIAGTVCVTLTVIRFVPSKDVSETDSKADGDDRDLDDVDAMLGKEEKQIDDDYINEFRFRTMNDPSIGYIEKQVEGGDQIVSIINSIYDNFNLYIVGRGYGRRCPLTSALSNWTDYPELGPLGETLVSFANESAPSVLIVQQSTPPLPSESSKRWGDSDY